MIKKQEVSITTMVNNYTAAKTNLVAVINSTKSDELDNAENELEVCFENLLGETPKTMDEMLIKFQVFFSEIESETELTQYHRRALGNILGNLKAYKSRSET